MEVQRYNNNSSTYGFCHNNNPTLRSPANKGSNEQSGDTFVKSQTEKTQKAENAKIDTNKSKGIPKYLYHFTNKKNYDSMMKSGKINISHNRDLIDGIYTVDLENFFKCWNKSPIDGSKNLKTSLLDKASGFGNPDIVILKIPTCDINPKDIRIRAQDEVIEFVHSKKQANLEMVYAEKGGIKAYKWELPKCLTEGYSPDSAERFNREGRAIEYIIKKDIDISNVELADQIPYENAKISSEDPQHINEIFCDFFKETPEKDLVNSYI